MGQSLCCSLLNKLCLQAKQEAKREFKCTVCLKSYAQQVLLSVTICWCPSMARMKVR